MCKMRKLYSIILSMLFLVVFCTHISIAENATNPNHPIANDESNKYLEDPTYRPLVTPKKKPKFTPLPSCSSLSGNYYEWCMECTGRGKTFGSIPVTGNDLTGYECR